MKVQHENRIASERVRVGMTAEDLAKELKITRQTLSSYEKGGAIPSTVLKQMVMIFGVSADYLLGLKNENKLA